ncbi:MAG TPA: DHA2 family efflux MFS transporter permease subunit, partial [Thermoanaerobaculia bacterium]|nr:DHA2 family efflux MFS transporter permease subunit [Thermoanaerobaculia bacterium]
MISNPRANGSEHRWFVLTAIGVGTFMSALDGSVVNTVLPLLSRELHASVAAIEWVATVYLLVVSALLLGVGRAGDLRGHKWMYIGGFALFVVGSALCGMSPTVHVLVAMRGLQAIGAAMLFANAPAILTKTFPAHERGRALGAQATFTYLGLTAGPSLGGWLAQAFGWRSVFYINLPVGAIGIALSLRAIRSDRPEKTGERFDYLGAAIFTAGLAVLLVALDQGHAWGWASRLTLSMIGAAVVLLTFFITVELRRSNAMLDLSLFRNRVFSAATASALLNYICVYSVLFVLPFLLIQGRGLNTQQAGMILTAQPIIMAIVAPISGAMSDRIGSRWLATAGMVILAIGLAILAMVTYSGTRAAIAGGLAVVGLGIGLFVSPNNSALMGAAPRHRQGIAAGVLATARNVGMVLGIGLAGAVFTTILDRGGPLPLLH